MRWRVMMASVLILALLSGGVVCRSLVERRCREVEALLRQAEAELQPMRMEEAGRLW